MEGDYRWVVEYSFPCHGIVIIMDAVNAYNFRFVQNVGPMRLS